MAQARAITEACGLPSEASAAECAAVITSLRAQVEAASAIVEAAPERADPETETEFAEAMLRHHDELSTLTADALARFGTLDGVYVELRIVRGEA